jgi:hypothetical protein
MEFTERRNDKMMVTLRIRFDLDATDVAMIIGCWAMGEQEIPVAPMGKAQAAKIIRERLEDLDSASPWTAWEKAYDDLAYWQPDTSALIKWIMATMEALYGADVAAQVSLPQASLPRLSSV